MCPTLTFGIALQPLSRVLPPLARCSRIALLLNAIPPYYNLRFTKHAAFHQVSATLFGGAPRRFEVVDMTAGSSGDRSHAAGRRRRACPCGAACAPRLVVALVGGQPRRSRPDRCVSPCPPASCTPRRWTPAPTHRGRNILRAPIPAKPPPCRGSGYAADPVDGEAILVEQVGHLAHEVDQVRRREVRIEVFPGNPILVEGEEPRVLDPLVEVVVDVALLPRGRLDQRFECGAKFLRLSFCRTHIRHDCQKTAVLVGGCGHRILFSMTIEKLVGHTSPHDSNPASIHST